MKKRVLFAFFYAVILATLLNAQNQYALRFDGTNDYVECGSDASLDITGPITIEAWVYLNGHIGIYKRFVEKDWTNSYFFGGKYGIDGVAFGMDPNGDQANILETANYSLPTYTWVHVAGWWDGSTLKIFINGEESASMPWVNVADGSPRSVKIGKYYTTPENLLNGYLDEIRIWSEARTLTQIRDNMYRELPNPASEPNLAAYWRCNEGIGQTIEDLSINNNTGYRGGTAAVEVSDPTWIVSTAPIPYYTAANGSWNTNATWAAYQMAPTKDWARVNIKNTVNVNSDETAIDVMISNTGRMTVDNTYTLNVTGDFRVKSDASGTGSFINNGTFNYANAYVERYYPGDEWHLISSPIADAVSGLFTGLYLQNHSEALNSFSDIIPVNIPMNPGQGYAIWNFVEATAEFNGTLNTGIINRSLTRSGAGNNFGWNLMGNPYCSSIDWDAATGWTKTNVDNAIYLHINASTWASYVAGVGINGGTRYIAPGQGYFVMVSDDGSTSGTLNSSDAVRVHNNTSFFKSEVADLVRIEISGNGYADETVIRFVGDATVTFDSEYDAVKLFGGVEESAQVYCPAEVPYSINALPETNKVNIGFQSGSGGTYTIAATEVNDLQVVILEDTEINSFTDLKSGSYPFTTNAGTFDDRFIIHFQPLAVNEQLINPDQIFAFNGKVYVKSNDKVSGEINIYNIMGQLINSVPLETGASGIDIEKSGNYIVTVVSNSNITTKKVFIR
jgi:hypothetical protein